MSQTPFSVELPIRPVLRKASSSRSVALHAAKSPAAIICWMRRSVRPRSFATSATTLSFGSSTKSFIGSWSHNFPHYPSVLERIYFVETKFSMYVQGLAPQFVATYVEVDLPLELSTSTCASHLLA